MFSLQKIPVVLFTLFLALQPAFLFSQERNGSVQGNGTGLSCLGPYSFWSVFSSQAMLASNKNVSAALGYENRFFIPELSIRKAGMVIKTGNSSECFMISYFGFTGYRRIEGSVGSGLQLSKNISAGLQVDYFSERIPGEDYHRQAITFEGGALYKVSEKVRVGFHLFNPLPASMRKEYLPSVIVCGAGIDLSSTLYAAAEVEKCSGKALNARCGFEYEALKKLRIRGGFSTDNSAFSFGVGYNVKSVSVDLAFSTHEKLGVSSAISVAYKIK